MDQDAYLPFVDHDDRHSRICHRHPDASVYAMNGAMSVDRVLHDHEHANDVHDGQKHEVNVIDVMDVYWL